MSWEGLWYSCSSVGVTGWAGFLGGQVVVEGRGGGCAWGPQTPLGVQDGEQKGKRLLVMLELTNLELKLHKSPERLSFKVWYFHVFQYLQACLGLLGLINLFSRFTLEPGTPWDEFISPGSAGCR